MVLSPPQSRPADTRRRRPPSDARAQGAQTHVSTARLRRRALTLLGLSIVLPGSAQLVAGNRAVGKLVLRTWLVALGLLGLLGVIALISVSAAVRIMSSPWILLIVQWALYAWAVVWALVVIDAWRLGRPDTQPAHTRRRIAIGTAVLMILPVTVAYAGASVSAGRSALSELFAAGPALATAKGRYNILLLGGDSGAGREGTRPDSLQLVSINAKTGRAATFGFTRDTSGIHFREGSVMAGLMPEGWACGDECLLNGLYTWAWDHKDQFPSDVADPGILATREAVEALSGLDIQYYAMVDLNGFRNLVDALGGLDIEVMRRTPIGGGTSPIKAYIEPGVQRLDGYHALWYARSRAGSSNYERMARQRCVMSAMVNQVDPRTIATKFPDIAAASTGVLRTDIPQSELGTFAELAMKTRSQKITGVNFVPPLITPWDFDVRELHSIVEETIKESDRLAAEEAVSTSAAPLPGVTEEPVSPDAADDAAEQAATSEPKEVYDPLARPSEDAHAEADDIASVCSVG